MIIISFGGTITWVIRGFTALILSVTALFANGPGSGGTLTPYPHVKYDSSAASTEWTLVGGTKAQQAQVEDAVIQIEMATGRPYVKTDNGTVHITIGARQNEPLLSDNSDWGYTEWYADGHTDIELVNDVPLQALTMHELMLARIHYETPDSNGLAGHTFSDKTLRYTPRDVELMEES